jgi:hypothetical protein
MDALQLRAQLQPVQVVEKQLIAEEVLVDSTKKFNVKSMGIGLIILQ